MQTEVILGAVSRAATTALLRFRFVNFAAGLAGATDPALGIANANYSQGEQAGINTHGQLLVEAGGAIAAGAQVQPDAQGRAVTLAAGVAYGRACDAAAAAGDIIRVLR